MSKEVASLKGTIKALQIGDLVETDWEALEHERQHGANLPQIHKETKEERKKRESILDNLQAKADEMVQKMLQV